MHLKCLLFLRSMWFYQRLQNHYTELSASNGFLCGVIVTSQLLKYSPMCILKYYWCVLQFEYRLDVEKWAACIVRATFNGEGRGGEANSATLMITNKTPVLTKAAEVFFSDAEDHGHLHHRWETQGLQREKKLSWLVIRWVNSHCKEFDVF